MNKKLPEIISAMNWRYAVKRFNSKKLTSIEVEALLEAVRLSPSSLGLLPYKIVVVENKAARKLIFAKAADQPKVLEASHLLVFCTYKKLTKAFVDSFIDLFAKERKLSMERVAKLRKSRRAFITETSAKELDEWAGDQAFIGLGVLVASAAIARIDAGPMGGFKPHVLDQILNLKKYNLRSRVMCAIGYRSSEDKEATQKKVRRPKSDFVLRIK
mgnify:CR=1 FL=1